MFAFQQYIPYVTDYKMHFFLRKIASKIQVRLILKINIKMSSVWFKILASLKNGHIFDAAGNLSLSGNIGFNWQQQCIDATNMSCGDSQVCYNNTVSLPSRHPKPRTLSSLWCIIAVYGTSELELKVICVMGNSTIFLLVANFVMEKMKGIHMMRAINWKYGNSIWRRTWKQSS